MGKATEIVEKYKVDESSRVKTADSIRKVNVRIFDNAMIDLVKKIAKLYKDEKDMNALLLKIAVEDFDEEAKELAFKYSKLISKLIDDLEVSSAELVKGKQGRELNKLDRQSRK